MPMKHSSYFLAVCAVACAASYATADATPQLAEISAATTEAGGGAPIAWCDLDLVDFSERNDVKLESDLAKLRQKTQPFILDLTWSKVGGDVLGKLRGLKHLRGIYLFGTDASDRELQHLNELPNLESIDLGGCKVTPAGILHLRASRKLKRLGLADIRPPLDDKGLKRIAFTWPNLELLNLDGCQITDAGLSHVGKLRHLRYLNVSKTRITDKGLKSLARLSRLAILHAKDTNIHDQGMVYLGQLTSLEKLVLNDTGISDRGLKEVRGLTNLKRIYLGGTKVTDDGLQYLKPLKKIEFVGVNEHISAKALEALKEALPLFKNNTHG
jgi:internalin A